MKNFFRDKDGHVVVWQAPNLPLSLWAFFAVLGWIVKGTTHSVVAALATLSLAVWAVLEIAKGASPFRRVLGLVVLIGIIAGLIAKLR